MRSGWLTTGEVTARFEAEFAPRGRAARTGAQLGHPRRLHLALEALGGPGNVVLTTPFTFAATAELCANLGADPVFCDIDSETLCIDPAADRKRPERRAPGAGVPLPSSPSTFAGLACDMDGISRVARAFFGPRS